MSEAERMDGLEGRMATLERRVLELELGRPRVTLPRPAAPSPVAPPSCPVTSTPYPVAPPTAARSPLAPTAPFVPRVRHAPASPSRDADRLEDLLGGRVLAWAGALAVVTGLVFLLVIAVSRGWIGEADRTLLAGATSLLLLAAGVRLHERKGRTEASLAAAAAGVAGLFGTFTVAGAVYDLVPALPALAGALATGAAATGLALRWRAPGMAALGIVGALLAPALVGAMPTGEGVAVLAIATASATAVVVWQRWTWLAFAAFAIATPQWLAWVLLEQPAPAATLAVLVAFGVLGAAAAVGFDLRTPETTLRISSAVLLVLNAFVLASAGWSVLSETASQTAGHAWLAGLAVAHLAVGLGATRLRRVSHELALAALALGVVLADIALASVLDGLPVLVAYAVAGTGFAALLRRAGARSGDEPFAAAGLGGHLLLALGQAVVLDAPGAGLASGEPSTAVMLALATVAAGCAVSARLAEATRPDWRVALDACGLGVVALLNAIALDGAALPAALAAQAVALASLARRTGDDVAAWGGVGFLVLAAGIAIGTLAPPVALVAGLDRPIAAALALGAVIAAAVALAVLAPAKRRTALAGAAAVGALYLASVELITPFQPGLEGLAIGELGARQQGQALLSALWALCGFAVLVAGLARNLPALRRGGLALLVATVAKVFLYDLASLTSIYRVASFIVLGLLLLGGAFAWQRVRPGALPDLRAVPDGLR